jgi:hypothetical protein
MATTWLHEYYLPDRWFQPCQVNLLGIKYQESLSWENKDSFGSNVKIRPVNFSTEHKNMLSNLHALVSKGFLAIDPKNDKLITSLRTA